MKKVLALVLSLMLLAVGVSAFAEEAPYEGTWVQFEDGFEIYLPSEWLQLEVTEDMLANGVFYAASSEDGAHNLVLGWAETQATTVDELLPALQSSYTGVEKLTINDIDFASYTDEANDSTGIVALDAEGGMFIFNFTPASDDTFAPIAIAIASSIRNIQA